MRLTGFRTAVAEESVASRRDREGMLTGNFFYLFFMAVKITSRHAVDLKYRESQFESDLATQAARFEEEKHALTQRFKNEM